MGLPANILFMLEYIDPATTELILFSFLMIVLLFLINLSFNIIIKFFRQIFHVNNRYEN